MSGSYLSADVPRILSRQPVHLTLTELLHTLVSALEFEGCLLTTYSPLVSGLTFPIRYAGRDLSWMLYNATDTLTNRVVSLIMKNIPLGGMHHPQAYQPICFNKLRPQLTAFAQRHQRI